MYTLKSKIKPLEHKDGTRYINVFKNSDDVLGNMVTPGYIKPFTTVIGTVNTLRSSMEYIVTKNYDRTLLTKKKITRRDIEKNSNRGINIPNYWAFVAVMIGDRIKDDEELKQLLIENELEFTSYYYKNSESIVGKVQVINYNNKLIIYLAILRVYADMLKDGNFNYDTIYAFIQDCKEDKSKSVFDSSPADVGIYL